MATVAFTKITDRQRKYIEKRVEGLNKRQAKAAAGFAPSTDAFAVETPSVKAALAKLVRQFVPAHVLAKRIAEGIDAEETKFFQKDGVVTDKQNVIAWSERREYLKLAAEYGQYVDKTPAAQVQANVGVTVINTVRNPRTND